MLGMNRTLGANIRAVLALVWEHASRGVRMRLGIVVLLVFAGSILTALGPLSLKWIVDSFTGDAKAIAPLSVLVAFYVASQWLARGVGELRNWVYARAERRMFRAMSEQFFEHLLRLPLRFHLNRQTGAVNQTLDNALQGYQMMLHHIVFTILPVAAELGTIVVVLMSANQPVFVWLFCGSVVCYGVAFALSAATIIRPAQMAAAAQVDANARMTDSLLNYETIKYFAAESTVLGKVSDALARTEDGWVAFSRRSAYNGLGVASIFAGFLAIAIGHAAHEVSRGRMTVGEFVLVNAYMLQVVRPVEMLGFALQALSQGLAMLNGVLDLFRQAPEPSRVGTRRGLHGPGRLEFRDVSVAYQPDRPGLRGVSFEVRAGKTLGIVGPSGAGKSTIVRLLVRMLEPDVGRVLIDDAPIDELAISDLRRAIAVVPQDSVLFNDTIAYNIAFGRSGSSQSDVEQAATLAHLDAFIARLPDGYATVVGERGVKLSGGEKQRVAIARGAIKQPLIYVFDEATSSLDSRTEQEILLNIRAISRSCTTLIIAHRLSTTVHADEIVVLDDGIIVERGTHWSLLRQRGVYARLWEAQQQAPAKNA